MFGDIQIVLLCCPKKPTGSATGSFLLMHGNLKEAHNTRETYP